MADLNEQMQLLKQGESSALVAIYESTKKSVFAIAFSILRDYGSAEDVMQETYLKIQSGINHYANGTNAGAWINTIARNLALNVYKKRKREKFVDFSEHDYLVDDYELKTKDESGIIQLTLKTLNENESRIVLMHTIGEIKLVEIAKIINKSSATVRWQYNNALKKLKKVIKGEQWKNAE